MPGIPVQVVLLFRCLITLAFSGGAIYRMGISPWGNNKTVLLLRGLFGTAGLTAYFMTLQHIPLASSVTLQYLSPVFTVLFARLLLGERLKWLQLLFFAVSFAGVVVVKGTDHRIALPLLALGICSALFSGLAYNMIRKARKTEHPNVVVFYFPLVALPLISVWCLYEWKTPTGAEWLWLLGTGVCTQFAQMAMTRAFMAEQVASVAGLQYLGLVYSFLIGWIGFGEWYSVWTFAGMLLVVAGVLANIFYADWQRRSKREMMRRRPKYQVKPIEDRHNT